MEPVIQAKTAAIALNNMAIGFLENGYCQLAMHTLTDAISLMKIVTRPTAFQDSNRDLALLVSQKLSQAYNQYAIRGTNVARQEVQPVVVVSYNDSPARLEAETRSHQARTMLIRIDPQEPSDHLSVSSQDLISSIIVFNYAQVYQRMAREAPCEEDSRRVLLGASRLFRSAYGIIESKTHLNQEEDDGEAARLFVVALLSLKNLVEIANVLHVHDEERARYRAALAQLQSNLTFLKFVDEVCLFLGAPAA